MARRSNVDDWWAKLVPADSVRTKIVWHIANHGPVSAYDIAKEIYKPASKGYAAVFKNLKNLEAEQIVYQVRTEVSKKSGEKKVYSLTEFVGVPCAWAYVGTDLDFAKLLETHMAVFRETEGLEAYKLIWQELGPQFCVEAARKAFIGIITGLDNKAQIFSILVGYILDATRSKSKIVSIARRNELVKLVISETRDELSKVLDAVDPHDLSPGHSSSQILGPAKSRSE